MLKTWFTQSETPSESVFNADLEQFTESMPDGIVIVDSHGIIIHVNTELERMFGYENKELIGHPVEILVPSHFRKGHVAKRDAYLEKPTRLPMVRNLSTDSELWGQKKDGTQFPIDLGLCPFKDNCGSVVASVRDISDLFYARLRIAQSKRELHEINTGLYEDSANLDSSRDELYIARQKLCEITTRLESLFGGGNVTTPKPK